MAHFHILLLSILPLLAILAGLMDLTTMKIPNRINLAALISFFPVAFLLGQGLGDIALSMAVGLGVLFIGMGMFALRWMGGGDAKLFAVVALWMGPEGVLPFIILSALAGGALSLVLMSARSWLQVYVAGMPGWSQRLLQPQGDIPYGVAIAAGALCAFPYSSLTQGFMFA